MNKVLITRELEKIQAIAREERQILHQVYNDDHPTILQWEDVLKSIKKILKELT